MRSDSISSRLMIERSDAARGPLPAVGSTRASAVKKLFQSLEAGSIIYAVQAAHRLGASDMVSIRVTERTCI